ncbi:MAG: decaprenyl-phosphate phosphoribosyltransferase [Herbiconiux sp.]|nr:MAG: decaprenyl-phosphate phosphoribosyltransferase [Herbiconiux sp.]
MRPRQWLKNVLVFAAPLAAGVLFDPVVWLPITLTFVVFCAASSGVYLINDLLDVESDRQHPEKRRRPIASGELSITIAWTAGIILLVVAPLAALLFAPIGFFTVVVLYEAIQIAYCIWFKHVVVIDLVIVSSGFLIRAIAGAIALSIPVSQWFLLVAAFGSLFMVAGKRFSEKIKMEGSGAATRRSLEEYSASYLRFVWAMSAGVAMVSYSLWAFVLGDLNTHILPAVSIIPFSMAILRYAYSIDKGTAGAPEDTVLGDRWLLGLGLVWLVVFGLSVVFR